MRGWCGVCEHADLETEGLLVCLLDTLHLLSILTDLIFFSPESSGVFFLSVLEKTWKNREFPCVYSDEQSFNASDKSGQVRTTLHQAAHRAVKLLFLPSPSFPPRLGHFLAIPINLLFPPLISVPVHSLRLFLYFVLPF